MLKFFKSFLIIAVFGVFAICLTLGATFFYLKSWGSTPFGIQAEIKLEMKKGMILADLSKELYGAGLVESAHKYKFWTKLFSRFSEFKAGTYKINSPVSPVELSKMFIDGSTYQEVKFEVLIPEGFRLESVVERFVNAGIGNREVFLSLARDKAFLSGLGIGADSIEGYLYPATYYYHEIPTESQVFKDLVSTFWKKLPLGYEALAASRGVNLYQAIIIASLIESETMYDEERSLIAEVIWNRLKSNMQLGIDAAVIYGIPSFNGNLTRQNLLDSSNPYNLRIHKGLPPTPINSPTASSLKAILNPSNEGYYYYVLGPNSQGRHYFSKNIDEHNAAVARYLDSLRK